MEEKKGIFSLTSILLIALLGMLPVAAHAGPGDDDRKVKSIGENDHLMPGWVVVKFKDDVNIASGASKTGMQRVDVIASKMGVYSVEKMFPFLDNLGAGKRASLKGVERFQRVYKMQFAEEKDPRLVAALLARLPEVEYAEPRYRRKIAQVSTRPAWFEPETYVMAQPNDPRFFDQGYFQNVRMEQAWDVVKGETGNVVVATVDGGTFWTHEDLQATVWVNPGEIDDNGVDDDLNGFTDDIRGWNFANDSNDPTGITGTPQNAQHGTLTAGLFGAQTNNNLGVASTTWGATYMPVGTGCPDSGLDRFFCFTAEGLMYAAAAGADIINASYGDTFRSTLEEDIVNFAYANGSLIIASSGNAAVNNDFEPHYPSDYNHVMSVGATGRPTNSLSDGVSLFSNVGVSVDIFAPGTQVLSTSPFNGYLTGTGTSFSSPIVAGVAALVKTQDPTLSVDQIREQVRATADDISAVNFTLNNEMGKGRLNAFRAVTEATPSVRIVSADVRDANGSSRINPGETATVTVTVTNFLEAVSDLNFTLESTLASVGVTAPTASLSNLNTGDTTTVAFEIRPSFTVASNTRSLMVLRMSSGDYTDIDAFTLDVNSTTHNTGNIEVTLTDQGNIGYEGFQGFSDGNGFKYLGFDFLFEGGLITGTGVNTISDNIRDENEDLNDDFVLVPDTDFGIIDGRSTTEEGALQLLDAAADIPLGTRVRLDSYADTAAVNRDFVILKYTIENTSSEDITDYYAGLFFDWDSFDDPRTDHARYDASRNMGYFLNSDPETAEIFLATKMLTNNGVSFRAIDNTTEIYGNDGQPGNTNDGFTDQEKWDFISGGIQVESLDATDIATLLSGGPFDIPMGGSIEVAFALVGGTTQEEIETHADAAQALWDNTVSSLGPNPVSNEDEAPLDAFSFELQDPYPNPAQGEAVIGYELPAASEVQLKVFDLLGREVRAIYDETQSAGKHSVTWDGRDNAGASLSSGVYFVNLIASTPEGPRRATKKVVLVR